jgi:hypothetical protein
LTPTAYTVGNATAYNSYLASDRNCCKRGICQLPDGSWYGGGWVWRTADEAAEFLYRAPDCQGFAVYGLVLPLGWDVDVSPQPDPEDGVHRLLHDARILSL